MPVCLWSLNMKIETCAICRNHIMDTCIDCQGDLEIKDDECQIAWGACNHAFHHHCINRWLKTRQVCPLDFSAWSYKDFKI